MLRQSPPQQLKSLYHHQHLRGESNPSRQRTLRPHRHHPSRRRHDNLPHGLQHHRLHSIPT